MRYASEHYGKYAMNVRNNCMKQGHVCPSTSDRLRPAYEIKCMARSGKQRVSAGKT